MLYPIELRAHSELRANAKCGLTRVYALRHRVWAVQDSNLRPPRCQRGALTNLANRPRTARESGKRDSNPRPQPWQGCALPTELFPRQTKVLRPARLVRPIMSREATQFCRHGGEGNRTPDLLNAIQAL